LSIDSLDKTVQTVVVCEIPSLGLRVACSTNYKYHRTDILSVVQVFLATIKKSLVITAKNAWYWRHSALFHVLDVVIVGEVFATAVSVTLEDHLVECVSLQDVDTLLVIIKVIASRTIDWLPTIDLNTGYAAILATALGIIFTELNRDAFAFDADKLLRYLFCR
jgi:hypothetical protein